MTFDVEEIKRHTDLLILIGRDTTLKRVASTKGGEYVGPCPFCGGEDRFNVWPNADPPHWWCRQCEKRGDAVDYIQQRDSVGFRAACQHLGDERLKLKSVTVVKSKPVVRPGPEPLNEEWQTAAAQVMVYCAAMLWEPEGEAARRWLKARGLADETLKRHFIGFNKADRMLYGLWVPRGITIGPSTPLRTGSGQALVGVVALGSAGNKVKAIDAGLPFLLGVKRLLVATDNDEEGERAAAYLLERTRRARRLRVPEGNDVTDYWKGGGDLREWVSICGIGR
jgi:hypothetical protein